jgi:hypothetical protein
MQTLYAHMINKKNLIYNNNKNNKIGMNLIKGLRNVCSKDL